MKKTCSHNNKCFICKEKNPKFFWFVWSFKLISTTYLVFYLLIFLA